MRAIRRRLAALDRTRREARMVARGLQSAWHPILAQIVPIRRCNLACAYCNEFDDHSPPVPTTEMLERIDQLARLETARATSAAASRCCIRTPTHSSAGSGRAACWRG